MHLSEYLKASLAKQKNNYLLVSEGGSGKTTSLLHSYKFFHSSECLCNGKRIIPIYIHLVNCDPNDKYNVCRQLVISCSYIDDPATDIVGTFAKFKDEIFNNDNCGFMFLVMLDAINEVHRGENMNREISELTKLKNVCNAFIDDIDTLTEIIDCRGVHPEVAAECSRRKCKELLSDKDHFVEKWFPSVCEEK